MVLFLSQKSFISLLRINEIIFSKYTIICLGKNIAPEYFFLSIFCQNMFTQKFSMLFFWGGESQPPFYLNGRYRNICTNTLNSNAFKRLSRCIFKTIPFRLNRRSCLLSESGNASIPTCDLFSQQKVSTFCQFILIAIFSD